MLNSLWDLQTFKTSLKLHRFPAVNTKMGCHFKSDTSKGILEILSADTTLSCPAWQKELLAEVFQQSLCCCFGFFSFCPFFGQMEESEQTWGLHKPQGRMEAGVPSSRLVWFFKRGWYVPNKEHKAYKGQADRTLFMVPAATPGPSLCIQPGLLPSHSRLSNRLL